MGYEPARTVAQRAAEDDEVRIVERVRAGDEPAFEVLVRRYYARLCRVALPVTRSYDAAEDVVIEVLANCWQRRVEWQVSGSVRSYLYRAVRNRAVSAIRDDRRRRAVPIEEALAVVDEKATTMMAPYTVGDIELALERAVAALPERCRAVYVMCREDGLSYSEIADVLGISARTVDAQLCKAMARLRLALAPFLK